MCFSYECVFYERMSSEDQIEMPTCMSPHRLSCSEVPVAADCALPVPALVHRLQQWKYCPTVDRANRGMPTSRTACYWLSVSSSSATIAAAPSTSHRA